MLEAIFDRDGAACLAPQPACQTPEEAWKAEIADANLAWSKKPHAILKIQDAAYLGEGDTATLIGTKGKPDSYHWIAGRQAGRAGGALMRMGMPA